MFTSPGAIAINTPFCTIYWYGIILATAFLVGQIVVISIANKKYNDKNFTDNLYEIAFWTLLGGILGARLYYVLLSSHYYMMHPIEIIMFQQGGLSIHGGLIGGIISSFLYCKKHSIEFFKVADLYALGLPIAQAIGRWGNFFNSEAFGSPTNLPWGVFIPENERPLIYHSYQYFHPTFLYESLLNIIIFLILFFIIKRFTKTKNGILFFSYLILYSFARIFTESIRIDSVLDIYGIPVAILICIITIVISLKFIQYINSKNEQ